ncbi:MAG: very short patch repair endonuclease [Niabella sp.]
MPKQYPIYEEDERIEVFRFEEANGFYTTEEKSRQMSRIRAKNTKPEIRLRKALWAAGIRYRKNVKNLPGSPDIAISKYKLAVFVDGDFWHGKDWHIKKNKLATNRAFWIPKIERNMQRDREVTFTLQAMGFTVFRFWESDINKQPGAALKLVLDYIWQQKRYK